MKKIRLLSAIFLVCWQISWAQDVKSVSGKVASETGEGLPGVSVLIVGTTQGTITDAEGNFNLQNVPTNGTLRFSSIGYLAQDIAVANRASFNISLVPDVAELAEIVVVGYGTQQKTSLTGAVSSVKVAELTNRSVNNVGKAIQGKIAGVQVVALSGAPGSSPRMQIRGYSSNGRTAPLYIVDGLQVTDIGYLDANSIASIDVLKDAASAAIYGAQAGNGVVLITTKTGKPGTSRFFYNTVLTDQQQRKKLDMMNTDQFKTYWTEEGITPSSFQNGDTDWNKEVYEHGKRATHTVGFEGGSDKANFYSAITYNKDNGMIVGDKDTYERVAGQINASYNVNSWLKVGMTTSLERAKINTVSENNVTGTGSAVGGAYFYDPTVPVNYANDTDVPPALGPANTGYLGAEAQGYAVNRNGEGKFYGSSLLLQSNLWNPLLMIQNYTNETWRSNVNGTFYADFKPVKGLVYTSRLSYRFGSNFSSNYTEPYYHNSNQNARNGRLVTNMNDNFYYQWENFANYSFALGKNNFTTMVGMQYRDDQTTTMGVNTTPLTSDLPQFRYLNYSAASANDAVTGDNVYQRSISYFARAGWNYDGKYLIEGSFRADAFDASKLPEDNRWGYFPAVSAGWVASNENFIKNLGFDALSNLKFRASWGKNGNVNVLNNYPYAPSLILGGTPNQPNDHNYSFNNTLGSFTTNAYPATRLPNPNITWEVSNQTDVAIETGFFGDRLTFGVDYYIKRTEGLLATGPAPVISGTSTVDRNSGLIENKGFEFELGWKGSVGDLKYGLNANLATLHNEVLETPYGDARFSGGGGFLTAAGFNGGGGTYFEKGYPIWYLRGAVVDHLDPTNGQPVYKTAAELGTNDGLAPLGSGIPKVTYGATLTASYKGFDTRIFGAGQDGSHLLWGIVRPDLPISNLPSFVYDQRWTPENPDAKYPSPRVYTTGTTGRYATSNLWVFSNSYFKIKEVQVGYTFPSSLMSPLKISSLRIYVSMEDFFTFTKYPGVDPESMRDTTDGSANFIPGLGALSGGLSVDQVGYPSMKQISVGLNLSF